MAKMNKCKVCGQDMASTAKTCPNCGAKNKKPIYKKWWFWLIVVIIAVGVYGNSENKEGSTTTSNTTTSETTSTEEPQQEVSPDEYKRACQTYNYSDISRNPNQYKGIAMMFRGKVEQIQESGKKTTLRINTTEGQYGIWEDTIWVDYTKKTEDESRILEDDIVCVYGAFNGIKNYKAVLGNEISIPWIKAEYIEIQ